MQNTEGRIKSYPSGGALAIHRRVRLAAGVLAYCSSTDTDCIGTTHRPAGAAGEQTPVVLNSAQGTHYVTAAGAYAAGATLYAADNGKVDDSGTVQAGINQLDASAADGDYTEMLAKGAVPGQTARSALTQDALSPYPVRVVDLYVWDAPFTNAVATTAANDDLAVVYNTFGTAGPSIESGDGKATTITRKVGFQFAIPPEYDPGETITLRIRGGMKTTVSDGTATIDAQVYRQGAPTVDICATSAQSINSLTGADKDFTLTPTGVVAGEILDVVLTVAITDSATATAVIGKLTAVTLLLDIKG